MVRNQATRRQVLRAGTGAGLAALLPDRARAAADFSGQTIRLVVGFGPGGTDSAARIFARSAEKHIAGRPTVIVENMPGAGTLLAQNFIFEKARPDGLTLGFNPFQFMAQLTGAPGLRFKYEDFTFIGGVSTPPFMAYARKDVLAGGLKAPEEVLKATTLRFAGREPIHGIDAITTLGADLMGIRYRYIPGYLSDAKVIVSIKQGETNFTGAGSSAWHQYLLPMIADTTILPLWSHAYRDVSGRFVKPQVYGEAMPTFQDVYRGVYGKDPAGDLWDAYLFVTGLQQTASFIIAGPPRLTDDVAAALRQGFAEAAKDPELLADSRKINGYTYDFVETDHAAAALASLRNLNPATVKFWTDRFERQRNGS